MISSAFFSAPNRCSMPSLRRARSTADPESTTTKPSSSVLAPSSFLLVHAADIALNFSSQALHQELRPMEDDQIERRIEAADGEGRNVKMTSVLLLSRLFVRPWISYSLET